MRQPGRVQGQSNLRWMRRSRSTSEVPATHRVKSRLCPKGSRRQSLSASAMGLRMLARRVILVVETCWGTPPRVGFSCLETTAEARSECTKSSNITLRRCRAVDSKSKADVVVVGERESRGRRCLRSDEQVQDTSVRVRKSAASSPGSAVTLGFNDCPGHELSKPDRPAEW